MANFPDSPLPSYSYDLEPEFSTLISPFDSGNEQRRSKWVFPRFNVRLRFSNLSKTDMAVLWNFFMARRGAYEAFYFFTPAALLPESWTGQYCGTGTGAMTTFDIPGVNTSGHNIYIDGVLQVSGYSILYGGGDGGSDRVEFSGAPASGSIVSADFAGRLRIRCRFKNDKMNAELFEFMLYRTGLELKGLGPA